MMNQSLPKKLKFFKEPRLAFGYNQPAIDPRDGLLLFGPYERLAPYSLKAGVVGTQQGLKLYRDFAKKINQPIQSKKNSYGKIISDEVSRPSFPGFEAVFDVQWPLKEEIFFKVKKSDISRLLIERNKQVRTSSLVDFYISKILKAVNEEDVEINIWFIIVPVEIYNACKPQSKGSSFSKGTKKYIELSKHGQKALPFDGQESYEDEISKYLSSSVDFHDLLKARLIHEGINTPVQLILEPTLDFRDKDTRKKYPDNIKAHLAWTQSTTLYYKLGKLPWKLNDIRDGVCYLGLVFKKLDHLNESKRVCSAAQMFLKDGDGSVFRGNIGLWQGDKPYEFHLNKKSAESLLGLALDDYHNKWNKYPNELFIHGKIHFHNEEWEGFQEALKDRNAKTKLTGIVIKEYRGLKLFRDVEGEISNYGVLRGLAYIISDQEGYLFTRGFIPRLNTSSSLEIPNPLQVKISKGEADIETVLKDVLGLTKLNYNACIYGDGLPVTLKFSDSIGKILTATKNWKVNKRQFKYYI